MGFVRGKDEASKQYVCMSPYQIRIHGHVVQFKVSKATDPIGHRMIRQLYTTVWIYGSVPMSGAS